jgi:hypothetical protein
MILIIPFKDGNNTVESRNSHIPGGKYILILFIAHKLQPDKSELKIPVQQQSKKENMDLNCLFTEMRWLESCTPIFTTLFKCVLDHPF